MTWNDLTIKDLDIMISMIKDFLKQNHQLFSEWCLKVSKRKSSFWTKHYQTIHFISVLTPSPTTKTITTKIFNSRCKHKSCCIGTEHYSGKECCSNDEITSNIQYQWWNCGKWYSILNLKSILESILLEVFDKWLIFLQIKYFSH